MAKDKVMLTYSGLKKYEKELYELKSVERQRIAKKIKAARAQGDISENADYDSAKEEQTEIEKRIAELESILRKAEVVADEEFDPATVNVGCEVKLHNMEYDDNVTYSIVGSLEANSLEGKISNESLVGSNLIGHQVGDLVNIKLPDGGEVQYKVLEIKKAV